MNDFQYPNVFVIQNEQQQCLSKQGEWLPIEQVKKSLNNAHKDIMLNELIEWNAKHTDARLSLIEYICDDKGRPSTLLI